MLFRSLDRPVSGLVIFAKTSKALTRLNEMFRTSEVKKTYWAVVKNAPKEPEGELVQMCIRDRNLSMSGIPYWTSDTGGFFVTERDAKYPDGLKRTDYKELYSRWFQFSAFTCLLYTSFVWLEPY